MARTTAQRQADELDELMAKYEDDDDVSKDPYTWQEISNAAMDFTPVLSDVKGIVETGEDLSSEWQKENPDYTYMGIVGGAGLLGAAVGAAPVIGDYASKALRSGARKYGRGLASYADDAITPTDDAFDAFVDDISIPSASLDATREGIHAASDSVTEGAIDTVADAGGGGVNDLLEGSFNKTNTDAVTHYEQNLYDEGDDLEDRAEDTTSEGDGERSASLFNLGGLSLADSTKGIMTPEGDAMAKKTFQQDPKATDKNNDGTASELEKVQAKAERVASVDTDTQSPSLGEKAIGMNTGGIAMPEDDVDPVSGNPIPVGSSAENVRDDIPAMLSQDEYVLPAHVVKWHGLKTITEMQSAAECGLMMLHADGLIGGQDLDEEESEEDDIEVSEVEDDDDDEVDTSTKSALPSFKKKKNISFIKS
jgi:hypothetical protein